VVAYDAVKLAPPEVPRRRLLVVSHPASVSVNQTVYVKLLELGWDVHVVVPHRWRHDFASSAVAPGVLPELRHRVLPRRVALTGEPGRHFYVTSLVGICRLVRPDVAFLEEETFSVAAFQWGRALARRGVAYGAQADENLDRSLPLAARKMRRFVLRTAAYIAARSPAAAELAERWHACGTVAIVPHTVPAWEKPMPVRDAAFTVGFAGRLVEEKGVLDLLEAASLLDRRVRLLFVGDGPLRAKLEAARHPTVDVEVATGVAHEQMQHSYARMHVLVLPSRTTPRWAEQFGRVLVEALLCGVPVVGSDSGAIPWVIERTGGGLVFPEGEIASLARILAQLQREPARRAELAERGRAGAVAQFGPDVAARSLDALLQQAIARQARP
jgi:glycosyltransferase involved in cell wall biosynthesis